MYFYAHIHDLHLLNFLLVWIVDLHLFNFLLVSIVRSKAWNRSISWGAWTTKSKASQFGMLLIFFWGHSYLYCWVLQWDTHPPRCRYSSLLFTMTTGSWLCSHVKRTPFMSLIHCPACPESQRLMVLYQHWRNICNKHLLDLSTASRSYRLNDKITSNIHLPKYSLLVLLLLLPHFCGWFFLVLTTDSMCYCI